MIFALVSITSLLQATPVPVAPEPAPVQPPAVEVSKDQRASAEQTTGETDPRRRVICRRENVLGTNRRERVCHSVRDRDNMRAEAQETIRTGQRGWVEYLEYFSTGHQAPAPH